jgi:hypothetical protein
VAALKAQGRGHAFTLLADALAQAATADDGLTTATGRRTVAELLQARVRPRSGVVYVLAGRVVRQVALSA